jgi:sugar phosphate isomerase/epimerase
VACVATSVKFSSPDADKRAENMAAAKANLDLAADLGAPVVRMFAGKDAPELTPEAAVRVATAFDEAGEYARPAGARPMLECGHDIIDGAAEARDVIARVTTKNFGALWNHSTIDDQTLDVLKGRLSHIHVHAEVLDPENANVRELAGKMKAIDYRGFVSLEIIKGENLPEDVLRETATRLKRFIAEAYGD